MSNFEREQKMFGICVAEMKECIAESDMSPAQIALSTLSDAQEELSMGHDDRARQLINRAKFIIDEHLNG